MFVGRKLLKTRSFLLAVSEPLRLVLVRSAIFVSRAERSAGLFPPIVKGKSDCEFFNIIDFFPFVGVLNVSRCFIFLYILTIEVHIVYTV